MRFEPYTGAYDMTMPYRGDAAAIMQMLASLENVVQALEEMETEFPNIADEIRHASERMVELMCQIRDRIGPTIVLPVFTPENIWMEAMRAAAARFRRNRQGGIRIPMRRFP
jgi:hypothetical protein